MRTRDHNQNFFGSPLLWPHQKSLPHPVFCLHDWKSLLGPTYIYLVPPSSAGFHLQVLGLPSWLVIASLPPQLQATASAMAVQNKGHSESMLPTTSWMWLMRVEGHLMESLARESQQTLILHFPVLFSVLPHLFTQLITRQWSVDFLLSLFNCHMVIHTVANQMIKLQSQSLTVDLEFPGARCTNGPSYGSIWH